MSHKFLRWSAGPLILIFAVSAYNIPLGQGSLSGEAQSTAASTLQASLTPRSTVTAPQSLIPVTPSGTPVSLSTGMSTPTYSVPLLTLREPTNCRTGPGQPYQIIITYQMNQTLEIVGRHDSGNFWLVKSAESPTGTCWLWGEYADVAGSYWVVPTVAPPPTATPPPAHFQAPSLQNYRYFCDGFNNTLSVEIIWKDRANNEAGYRIFRDGRPVAELPPDSTAYAETIGMPLSLSAQYYVQVYHATASADMSVPVLTCN